MEKTLNTPARAVSRRSLVAFGLTAVSYTHLARDPPASAAAPADERARAWLRTLPLTPPRAAAPTCAPSQYP